MHNCSKKIHFLIIIQISKFHHRSISSLHFFMAGPTRGPRWYFSKWEIEENSPSRQDGIDANMETIQRRTYTVFQLQLGSRLGLTREAIARAIVYCHRFFLRRSLARNNIRTACMLLASGNAHDFHDHDIYDVVSTSYELIHKNEGTFLNADPRCILMNQEKNSILTAWGLC